MRITATLFLLLALSLPAFAHHDRDHHRSHRHRRVVVEDCGPRIYVQRHHPSPYAYPPPGMIHHPRRWREFRHRGVYLPPPPIVVRPRGGIWIGF